MKKIIVPFLFLLYWNPIFTQQTVGLFLNDSLSLDGYTLFSPNENIYLIDNCGFVVHSWRSAFDPGLSVYLLENGQLLRAASRLGELMGAGGGGRIELFSWEGDVLWQYDYSSTNFRQHHDIEPLPNGNILLLAWEVFSEAEAIAAGRNPATLDKDLWPDHIVEISPKPNNEAEIVWEWHAWDHLVQEFDSTKNNFGIIAEHPELIDINLLSIGGIIFPGVTGVDWMHSNGLSYNEQRDEIILSVRNFSEVFVIDHSTTTEEAAGHSGGKSGKGGDLLYRWGNPQNYHRGDSSDQRFMQQHDPKWIPEGFPNAGRIMVYNNGNDRMPIEYSSVEWIEPPLNAQGQYLLEANAAFGPQEAIRTYDGMPDNSFFSGIMSGAQPLSNGNTLICVASEGHLFEITPDGKIVWDYRNPVGSNGPVPQGSNPGFQNVFRATRFTPDYPAFEGRDLIPGDPIELDPLPSDCILYPDPISSLFATRQPEAIRLHQNPIKASLLLHNETGEKWQVEVSDLLGRIRYNAELEGPLFQLNTTNWAKGYYVIRLSQAASNRHWLGKVLKN